MTRVLASAGTLLLALALAPWPASAQMSPPPGVLTLPKKQPPVADTPVSPPQAAPVTPVEQVAPFASPRVPAAPAKPYVAAPNAPAQPAVMHKPKKPTPVVRASHNSHAQRPSAASAAAAKPAAVPPAEASAAAAAVPAVRTTGSVTNLPLPRWASLRADEVNLRVGPGLRFPIEWQYHRRDLPVEILREVEVWRLIEDEDGVKGWVHSATLTGRRSFVVKVPEAVLRAAGAETAVPVARLKAGVVGRIRDCDAGAAWCEVQVDEYRGFLRRDQFFGTMPGEAVGN
jgi:SH3-like domain-containing protein